MNMDNPRQIAKDAIKTSVPTDLWAKNEQFVRELQQAVTSHPVASHRAIRLLNEGTLGREAMKQVHLEYRHAIVQIFTDALVMAQHQSRQVEPRLAPGSKMYARFLLTLNDLDEFGFRPGVDKNGYYRGNPSLAHYPLFEKLLDDYGVTQDERITFKPSAIADEVRRFLESSYSDFALLAALLAVAEEEVVLYSPPLRRNTAAVGLDVEGGYYFVHGTSDEEDVDAFDDDHEDDLWQILKQAITPDQYDDVLKACLRYCDLWVDFWSHQMRLVPESAAA